VKDRIKRDNLSIIAASVAFYALLAIFPGLIALVRRRRPSSSQSSSPR
jgi:uncharacterized BrkB/YihY/UPF0761 family membrane protein